MPSRKRNLTSAEPSGSRPKRARKTAPEPEDVIILDDFPDIGKNNDEDEEFASILAQIKAQEESERLARALHNEMNEPSTSGSKHAPIDLEDDEAMARRLAGEWAHGDTRDSESEMQIIESNGSPDGQVPPSPPSRSQRPSRGRKPAERPTKDKVNVGKVNAPALQPAGPPDERLEPFQGVFTESRNCTNCNQVVNHPRGCVMFSDTLLPPTLTYLLHSPCSSCRTNHCRGCFKPISCPVSCKGPSKNPKCTVTQCCAEVRATALFEALGGFDRQFISERAASQSRAMEMEKKKPANSGRSVGPGGTGYGVDSYDSWAGTSQSTSQKAELKGKNAKGKKAEINWENIVLRAFTAITELLPAPYAESAQIYDMLPHPSIGFLISLSQIPTLLADLLRNDSVTDWISRKEVYNAMLSLLRRMADCELTIQCLIGERWEPESTCGLENWMWSDGEIIWAKNAAGKLESATPLYNYFKKLTKQSEAFLSGAMQALGQGDDEGTDEEETLVLGTSLCGDIIAARDDLERAIGILGQPAASNTQDVVDDPKEGGSKGKKGASKKGKARDMSLNIDREYTAACEKLAFKHVSLGSVGGGNLDYANYNYREQLTSTQNATRQPKSRFHLVKELAVTATSLPPGIWIRVDEVRNDAIKVMIAGPDGTPYSGGLFEFDCFLPIQYPAQPPLMHLRTTGGGKVRFNPNLYNCGKVCLSLLGTWAGRPEEQWSPSKSTLLQVLVSIQSMILIEAPYFNEPGHGQVNLKSAASVSYNRNITTQTINWAILDWLNDKHRNSIWKDVIVSHFSICKDKIRQKISDSPGKGVTGKGKGRSKAGSSPDLEKFDEGLERVKTWDIGDEID